MTIRLTTLTRLLDDEVQLAAAFGLPEITALGDSEHPCRLTLQAKAKAILEHPSLSPPLLWFRRRFGSAVEAGFAAPSTPDYESEVAQFFRPEFFNRLDAVLGLT